MSPVAIALTGISVLLVLLAFRIPVAFAMFLVGFIGVWSLNGLNAAMGLLASESFTLASNPELIVIPLFILMGNVASVTGMSRRLYEAAYAIVGQVRGGLAAATVIGCGGFAALSGSSVASALTMGKVSLAEMDRFNYDPRLSTGVVAAGGTLGILIPPSTGFVIYAILSEQSIGRLFMAGVIPGIILASMLGATTYWRARVNNYPRMPRADWRERWQAFRESIWGLMLIVIIMGGIYGGFFTPTEAAAVSAVYAFVIAVWVYKDIKLRDVPRVLLSSAAMSAMLLYIITNAVMFAFILTSEQIPQSLSAWIVDLGFGKIGFLLIVNVMLLMIGMVMEPSAIVLIMAPILYPVAVKLGVDPVHFGIMMVVNMEIGLCTPPVGLNLYVGSAISKLGLTEVSKAALPWLMTALVFLMLVTYIPAISLWLPRMLGM